MLFKNIIDIDYCDLGDSFGIVVSSKNGVAISRISKPIITSEENQKNLIPTPEQLVLIAIGKLPPNKNITRLLLKKMVYARGNVVLTIQEMGPDSVHRIWIMNSPVGRSWAHDVSDAGKGIPGPEPMMKMWLTIFEEAFKDGAAEIQFTNEPQPVVNFRIGQEWKKAITIPPNIAEDAVRFLLMLAKLPPHTQTDGTKYLSSSTTIMLCEDQERECNLTLTVPLHSTPSAGENVFDIRLALKELKKSDSRIAL